MLLRTFSDCHKPHSKAIYDTSATAGKPRPKPYIPVPAVYLLAFSDCHQPHNKAIYGTSATAGIYRCNRTSPFLPYYCVHSLITTNRIAMRLQCVQSRRFAIARNAPTIPKAELEAAHSRKNGRHILSVPAVLFFQYNAVKPHCKAK